jgi:hypothetical protein
MAAYCYLCDRQVYSDGKGDCAPQKDHIAPVSRVPGREDDQSNIRWVHAWCNQVKGDRTVSQAKADIAEHFRRGTAPYCLR